MWKLIKLVSTMMVIINLITSCSNYQRYYIALGDSVSSGYGLNGYPASPEGRHPSVFFARLKSEGVVDEHRNMAASGLTTTSLLEQLNNMSGDELRRFRNARIVTVNIGGNNILMPFLTYLSDSQLLSGVGNIRAGAGGALSGAWAILHEIVSGIGGVISDSTETSFSIGNVVTGLVNIASGVRELTGGAREMIDGSPNIVSTWKGVLSPELEAVLKEGVQTFSDEFKEIIRWLNRNAPDARIIVNTIYNPIPQDILLVSVPISYWANAFIGSINDVIIEESKSKTFLVTDINFYFSNRPDLMNFNLNPFAGGLSLDIIHPNIKGHSLIAKLNHATFKRYIQDR